MGAPLPDEPCVDLPARPPVPGGRPLRVVEVMATGTNGGAQEHVYSLLSRMDRTRYEPSVVSLSPGSAVRAIRSLGIPVTVFDEPDDAIAVGAVVAHLSDVGAEIVHNHMYRAELVGTRAAIALGEAGHRRPWVIGTVHSSRIRAAEDREVLRHLTPQMNHLVAVSRAIVHKIAEERPSSVPVSLVHNGVDLARYDRTEACCTLAEEYRLEPNAQIVGVVGRLEPEKGHPTLIDAWPRVLRTVPDAYLLIVGEGSRREALEHQVAELGIGSRVIFTGRRDDVPAVTAALDVAVLPSYREAQGLTILEAMALSRPVVASNVGGIPEMVEDGLTGLLVPPHDPEALAAAITRLLVDHSLADMLARAGHDLVHERFCLELMVRSIEDLYDEGATAIRRPVLEAVAAG
jgi:glycosyltransferase involved in cell wall biosynthesis